VSATFTTRLLAWFGRHCRDLPWRAEPRDPYRVWISEIMLQQTRVEAVLPYYERFLGEFPTVERLARAPEADVLACWSGLGYYSRARLLLHAAQRIAASGFPRDYDAIRALPGVGPYTAAAISSIAFGLCHPALDGNVMRVAARVSGDPSDIRAASTRRRFEELVRGWLDPRRPGRTNEALMELGATVCLPREPRCAACPVAGFCRARAEDSTRQLPVKRGRPEPLRVEAALAVVTRGGRVLLRQRALSERKMAGFWELPAPDDLPGLRSARNIGTVRHTITHRNYTITVVAARISAAPPGMRWFQIVELRRIPVSTASRKALLVAKL